MIRINNGGEGNGILQSQNEMKRQNSTIKGHLAQRHKRGPRFANATEAKWCARTDRVTVSDFRVALKLI